MRVSVIQIPLQAMFLHSQAVQNKTGDPWTFTICLTTTMVGVCEKFSNFKFSIRNFCDNCHRARVEKWLKKNQTVRVTFWNCHSHGVVR